MQNKTNETIRLLNEIKEHGYIHLNMVSQYYQKINHSLAELFKNPPVDPKVALGCMEGITQIARNTPSFFSLFSKQIQDLHDWASTGDELTTNSAKTQLLFFFSHTAPDSIDEKKRLMASIQNTPRLKSRQSEISKVLEGSVLHYEKNHQYIEDPHTSFLEATADTLDALLCSGKRFSNSGQATEQKLRFFNCAMVIAAHAPHLYNPRWNDFFDAPKSRYFGSPILEAPVVPQFVHRPHIK